MASDDEKLKAELSGRWKIESATNVDAFLKKRDADAAADVVFRLADNVIEFDGDAVTTYDAADTQRFNEVKCELFQLTPVGTQSLLVFISDYTLKSSLTAANGDEVESTERFVSKERLHVVVTRDDVTCTRIYAKSPGPPVDDTCPAELAKALEEIERLKARVAELEEQLKDCGDSADLEKLKAENAKLTSELATAKARIATLEEELKNCASRKELDELKAENGRLKTQVATLQAKDAASTSELAQLRAQFQALQTQWRAVREQLIQANAELAASKQRVAQLEQQLRGGGGGGGGGGGDILQRVVGTWKYRADFQDVTRIVVNNNTMVLTNTPSNVVLDYPIGRMNSRGYTTTVENNKIVMRNQQIGQREEWSLENGQVVLTCYNLFNNSVFWRYTPIRLG